MNSLHRRVSSNFLLMLPATILSDPVGEHYGHYVHDAQRHYQWWVDMTAEYNWPTERTWVDHAGSSTHSCDSRPEVDMHLDEVFRKQSTCSQSKQSENEHAFSQRLVLRSQDVTTSESTEFDEGPFFRMLYKLLGNMPSQSYQVNLHLTSIFSNLALMPHAYLHEYLLNPLLPTAKGTKTLFKVLQEVAKRITKEIPMIKNYKQLIETTRLQLMSEDPDYDVGGHHNQLVESLIVLDEFCKELAAIAFVKYQYSNIKR